MLGTKPEMFCPLLSQAHKVSWMCPAPLLQYSGAWTLQCPIGHEASVFRGGKEKTKTGLTKALLKVSLPLSLQGSKR